MFEDPYTDDPGVYVSMAEAIKIAAPYEEILFNGTSASSSITGETSENIVPYDHVCLVYPDSA